MLVRRTDIIDLDAANPVVRYVSPLLESAGVPHGFSTRLGGVSSGVFSTMNLGNPNGSNVQDTSDNLARNHRRLFVAAGLDPQLRHARVHQVHGDEVALVQAAAPHDPLIKADALATDDHRSIISVRVADCVPVLLASANGQWVAAVHAGWRGVIAGVVEASFNLLRQRTQQANPIFAAIGPSISRDAFEVGEEVADQFRSHLPAESLERIIAYDLSSPATTSACKPHIDLREAIRHQLQALGVACEHIDMTDRCTVRDADEFFSHRRDHGITGRMAAFISPRRLV